MHKDSNLLPFYRPLDHPDRSKISQIWGYCTIESIINSIRSPRPESVQLFKRIAEAAEAGDIKLKNELKSRLISWVIQSVPIPTRKIENIDHYTGYLVAELDNLHDQQQAEDLKQHIFHSHPEVLAAFLSPSRKGVKFIIRIPQCFKVLQFHMLFDGVLEVFAQYPGVDPSYRNPVLLTFQCFDPGILHRQNPEVWYHVAKPAEPVTVASLPTPPANERRRQKAAEIILKGLQTRFERITNVGHPNVRGIARTAGGYIAGGYLDESEAIRFIESWIDHHDYLRKKARTYKRTARWAIDQGKHDPLTLQTIRQQ